MASSNQGPKPRTQDHQFPELAALLRRRRYACGLTVKEVALAAGVAPWTVKWLEMDKYVRLPEPEVIHGLARALEVPVGELLAAAGYSEEGSANA